MPYWFDDGHVRLPWSIRVGLRQLNLMCRLFGIKMRWCPTCGHPLMQVSKGQFLTCPYEEKPTHPSKA